MFTLAFKQHKLNGDRTLRTNGATKCGFTRLGDQNNHPTHRLLRHQNVRYTEKGVSENTMCVTRSQSCLIALSQSETRVAYMKSITALAHTTVHKLAELPTHKLLRVLSVLRTATDRRVALSEYRSIDSRNNPKY